MADYYVDIASGDDAVDKSNNSSSAPWARLERALVDAVSGDTVHVTAPLMAPKRAGLIFTSAARVQSATSDHFHVSASIHAKSGQTYIHESYEDYCNNFDASTTPTGFVAYGSGTASLDTNKTQVGGGAIKLDATSDNIGIRDLRTYRPNLRVRYRIRYETEGTTTFRISQRGSDSDEFHFDTGNWQNGTGIQNYNLAESEGVVTEYVSPWMDEWSGTSEIDENGFFSLQAAAGTAYVHSVVLEVDPVWVDEGDYYSMEYYRIPGNIVTDGAFGPHTQTPHMWKCLESEWPDLSALDYVPTVGSTGALTAGTSYIDTTNQIVYYMPASGESLEDVHLEFGIASSAIENTSTGVISKVRTFCGARGQRSSGADSTTFESPSFEITSFAGFQPTGTGTTTYRNMVDKNYRAPTETKELGGGGLLGVSTSSDVTTVVIEGWRSVYAGDDACQPLGNGDYTVRGFEAIYPWSLSVEPLFNAGTSGTLVIDGLSSTGGLSGQGLDYKDLSTVACDITLQNCAFQAIEYGGAGTSTVYSAITNCYCAASAATGTAPAQDSGVTYDATFDVAGDLDLTPLTTSDLYEARVNTVAGFVPSANGQPFMRVKGDAGGIQSSNSDYHPANT